MRLEAIRRAQAHAQKCPTCGGEVQRRQYGEMYAGSFISDGKRVEIRRIPHAQYADPIILDALTQYFDGGLYRKWPGEAYYSRGGKRLHREMWRMAFGNIPGNSHIHHRDEHIGDKLSNLECMPKDEHNRVPHGGNRTFSVEARNRAADWHRSEEGRLWHRRQAERSKSWTKWKRVKKFCPYCRKKFMGLVRKGNSQIYCSAICKSASRRFRHAPA